MADTTEIPIPPPNFLFLVESILMQAQIHLGLVNLGEKDEEAEANLPLARHSIDLLAMLQEKTKGNLTVDEQRLIENGLTELRFRFVQVVDEQKRKTQPVSNNEEKKDDTPRIITADGGKGTKTG